MKKLIMILTCVLASVGLSLAQTTQVNGTVLDDTGETVIGASVVAKGTTVGTVTDIDGNFTLNIPTDKKVLIISLIGYKTKEVAAGKNLNILMETNSKLIDEIVVTGYGIQKKATFTGSATTVEAKALSEIAVTSVDKALQGNATGLYTQASSGQPGAGQRIVIRGIGSIKGDTEPLWIIDGVPVATGNFGQLAATGETDYSDNSNALAGINPNDIANITVLKDASATSIYGSRAANGVVLVTTKSGSEGKTRFNLSTQYGWSSRATKNFKVLNQEQYLDYIADARINAGLNTDKASVLEYVKKNFPLDADGNLYNYDWMKRAYRDDAATFSINLQASGGNNKTKYFTSIGYYSQEGILESSDMNRTSAKLNLTHSYSDKLRFGMNNSLSFVKQETPLTTSAYYTNPVLASTILSPIDPGEIDGEVVIPQALSSNFLFNVKYNYAKQRTYRVVSSAFAEYDIIPDLTFKTVWGVDFMQLNESQWDDQKTPGNTAYSEQMNKGGRATRGSTESLVWDVSNTLSYNKTFDTVHNLGVMVGQEISHNAFRDFKASSEDFPSSDFKEMTAGATPITTKSRHTDSKLASFFGRVNYSYDNRYILSTSFRRDGSSRFPKDNLYANFWSVGGQWRMSQESFLNQVSWISNLGLRASYGTTGNSSILLSSTVNISPEYPWRGLYDAGANYAGASGIYPYQILNNDLKWEKAGSFNVGVDFSVLNNRLSAIVDIYSKKTSDLLLDVNLSSTTGFLKTMKNVGSMRNQGIEFTLNAIPVMNKDFEWNVSFNISSNKNKVLELYEGQPITTGTRTIKEGEDVQSIYTYEWAGVDPEDGNPMWYDKEGNKVKDHSKAEKRIVGSAAPKFYGGLTNTFRYKDFDFSALFYFSSGNKISDQTLAMSNSFGARGWYNQSEDLTNRWRNPGDVTDVPKVVWADSKRAPMSSRYVYDGSYIRLRNITVGYTIPKTSGLRVYFQGTNLLTITDYKGFDPEVGIKGDPWYGYPMPKTILFGVDYKF